LGYNRTFETTFGNEASQHINDLMHQKFFKKQGHNFIDDGTGLCPIDFKLYKSNKYVQELFAPHFEKAAE
jgi:hypothetical protein